jgi:hypothetical protein
MSTGDEPGLGREHDNAPMISGRGTNILVSARGAYVVGNLHALINHLDEVKQHRFKLMTVQHARDFIGSYRDQSDDRSSGALLREILSRFLNWLHSPTDENLQHLREVEQGANLPPLLLSSDLRRHGLAQVSGTSIWSLITIIQRWMIQCHCLVAGDNSSQYRHLVERLVRGWHVEAAWSLLAEAQSPAPLLINTDLLQARLADPEQMRRDQNIDALIYLMSGAQLFKMRQVIRIQALWYARKACGRLGWLRREHRLVKIVERWLDSPISPTGAEYRSMQDKLESNFSRAHPWLIEIGAMLAQGKAAVYFVLTNLVETFAHVGITPHPLYPSSTMDRLSHLPLIGSANSARETARFAILSFRPDTATSIGREDESEGEYLANEAVQKWQVEAAWAILHDQPIPPLESV